MEKTEISFHVDDATLLLALTLIEATCREWALSASATASTLVCQGLSIMSCPMA